MAERCRGVLVGAEQTVSNMKLRVLIPWGTGLMVGIWLVTAVLFAASSYNDNLAKSFSVNPGGTLIVLADQTSF